MASDLMSWPPWRSVVVASRTEQIRILVVDDHEIIRREFCALLRAQAGFVVISDVANGEEAIRKAKELQPDVVLLDISLPRLDGFAVARHVRKFVPSAEILFVSQHDTRQMVREAMRAGGRGYVIKLDAAAELVPAVRAVSERKQFISRRLAASA